MRARKVRKTLRETDEPGSSSANHALGVGVGVGVHRLQRHVQPQGPTTQGASQTSQTPTGSSGSSSTPSATTSQRNANLALYGAATGAEVIHRWHLGGVILLDHNTLDPNRRELSTGNVNNAAQITTLTAGLQQAVLADSGLALLVATDQEGVRVQRIRDGVTRRPSQEQIAGQSEQQLRCGYFSLGRQLRQLGVNQDFAAVADVVRTTTGVIGDRSFGPDPNLDARDVVAAVTGLQKAGVLATLKHWPGHGSTSTDSHEALPVIHESAARWKAVDRRPFQAGAAVAASVMVGQLAFPALDPSGTPATLSPRLVDVDLRRIWGIRAWSSPTRSGWRQCETWVPPVTSPASLSRQGATCS